MATEKSINNESKSMSEKPESLTQRLKVNFKKRKDDGASTLGPIVIVGMMIVIIAASIASATSFAAKISFAQVDTLTNSIEERSILNSFVSKAYTGSGFIEENLVAGAGRYYLYYSSSETQPTGLDSPGLELLTGSVIPPEARWILVEMALENEESDEGDSVTSQEKEIAVYAYSPLNSPIFDSAIQWKGSANLQDTTLRSATGVQGANYIYMSESTTDSKDALRLDSSDLKANLFADYSEPVEITKGKVSGNLSSNSSIYFYDNPEVRGDAYSASEISGEVNLLGTPSANYPSRPLVSEQSTEELGSFEQSAQLTAANCSDASTLKTTLESFDRPTTVTGAELCNENSWNTEIKVKSNILVQSSADLTVKNLKAIGSTGSLGFASEGNLKLQEVNYEDGAFGQFLSANDLTVENSNLTGSVSGFGSNGGSLNISDTVLSYRPVITPLNGNCGTNSCAISSNNIHLLKVS